MAGFLRDRVHPERGDLRHGVRDFNALERHTVGLVISDYRMPHMDGIQFTAMLKADPRHQNTSVILMTGNADGNVHDKGLRKGVAMTLEKPLDFNQLLNLVRFAE